LFTSAFSTIYEYFLPSPTSGSDYVGLNTTPIIGKPYYKIYSYAWGGLDPNTGDPLGFVHGKLSKDYNSIINGTSPDSIVYNGSTTPTYFGALRNTFSWKNLSLSVNISYKAGYYFIRNSITSYGDLFRYWRGHSDYSKRWQQPGDELHTDVPSLVYTNYPQFGNRENFYLRSSTLVEKGDHVGLEDINLSYSIRKENAKRLPFREINLYAYVRNMNVLLWKANKRGVDPRFNNAIDRPRPPISLSFGANIIL
jgi:hypothetical protein